LTSFESDRSKIHKVKKVVMVEEAKKWRNRLPILSREPSKYGVRKPAGNISCLLKHTLELLPYLSCVKCQLPTRAPASKFRDNYKK
jgi:hypothetical protein